ncbi:MAG: Do family serine endopeptidase [Rickettsiaceae bacterium]
MIQRLLYCLNLIILAFTYSNAFGVSEVKDASIQAKSKLYNKAYPSFAEIVEPLIPTVVSVYVTRQQEVSSSKKSLYNNFPLEHFADFFDNIPPLFDKSFEYKSEGFGSGFIINPNGLIITNHHVIQGAEEIKVKLNNDKEEEFVASLIGSDQKTDLALIKINAKNDLPFVRFEDSDKSRIGDWVIAIGNPLGFNGTVTTGIISSKGRDALSDDNIVDKMIQTDAAINIGNSGGPLFDVNGYVIGINTAIATPRNIGIGFAIPSNIAKYVINELQKHGKIDRGYLGVIVQDMTQEITEGLGLDKNIQGVLVVQVIKNSCGEKAGLLAGDIITNFGNYAVKNRRSLQVLVAQANIGQKITIKILRNNEPMKLICNITSDTDGALASSNNSDNASNKHSNETIKEGDILYSNLTDDLRKKFRVNNKDRCVLVLERFNNDNAKQNINLHPGDIVIAANHVYVQDVDQLKSIYKNVVNSGRHNIVLLIKRKEKTLFIAVPIESDPS